MTTGDIEIGKSIESIREAPPCPYEVYDEFLDVQAALEHEWEDLRRYGSFDGYVDAVRERLSRYGITQKAHLLPNYRDQDKLTTWLEYVNFEYFWYKKSEFELLENPGLRQDHQFLASWAHSQIPGVAEEMRAAKESQPGYLKSAPTMVLWVLILVVRKHKQLLQPYEVGFHPGLPTGGVRVE